MAKSTAYASDVLNNFFGSEDPATLYIGLYTATPAANGTGGTEVAGGSYARAAVTNDRDNFALTATGETTNENPINFAVPTANWGNVGWVGIFVAGAGGVPKYWGALVAARTINNGDAFGFAATQLVITES